ncbi:similar to Saccharomyces cerevisiae YDR296W MHR1 Protein involved in homologous recombination in mitochondria [Maudiozyma saulgeensis]|uniref:Large ribosomal subunit protein mL67 n=1 Tax=Maudiozyma saulgeensis TaxID=1789683 RepID=A0A1X7R5A1_9SACH|nr:similar to Saccharomyces cerevisiae YDR296W MHR1 Protein involved in homologous recombination in mitochondria [Kazachstania saulgeensis]
MSNKSLINKGISRFRPAQWLQKKGLAPHVYLFRNLEKGQVVYSQMPLVSQRQIDPLFLRPNWDNKKPSTRRDLWKCMAVVRVPSHLAAVQLFQNLSRLRYMRDVLYSRENDKLRMKNDMGRVWHSGHFRPGFAQEAVADLKESLLKLDDNSGGEATIFWEDPWRMGDLEKYWTKELPSVKHEMIDRNCNVAREESQILKELAQQTLESMEKP